MRTLIAACLFTICTQAAAQEPRWTLEIKSGKFEPELDDWDTFYGDDETDQSGISLAYKLIRQFEIGLGFDYIRDKGTGTLELNMTPGGDVTYHLYPLHLYAVLRGVFSENQWVVPYVGGGISRAYYRQEIRNQGSVRGNADGGHRRAGLQILLDWLDEGSAAGFEEENVKNTYLIIEAQSFNAEIDGIELGGDSTYFGLVFEF